MPKVHQNNKVEKLRNIQNVSGIDQIISDHISLYQSSSASATQTSSCAQFKTIRHDYVATRLVAESLRIGSTPYGSDTNSASMRTRNLPSRLTRPLGCRYTNHIPKYLETSQNCHSSQHIFQKNIEHQSYKFCVMLSSFHSMPRVRKSFHAVARARRHLSDQC